MKKPVLIVGGSILGSILLLSILMGGRQIGELLALIFPWPLPIFLLVLWLAGCLYLWRVQRAHSKAAERPKSPLKKIIHTVLRSVLWLGVLLLGGIVLFFFVVLYPLRYEGSYRGKVIDADTGAPIAGVVILGVWYREYPTVAGGMERYHDAREVVTNANGDFTMPGKGLLLLSNIVPARVFIFKAGYKYLGPYFWEILKESRLQSQQIHWEGEKAIIPLKKLTLEERKKRLAFIGLAGSFPQKKQKLLIRELNKESVELGRRPSYEEPE